MSEQTKKIIKVDSENNRRARYISVPLENWMYGIVEDLCTEIGKQKGQMPITIQGFAKNAIMIAMDAYIKQFDITIVYEENERLKKEVEAEKARRESDEQA